VAARAAAFNSAADEGGPASWRQLLIDAYMEQYGVDPVAEYRKHQCGASGDGGAAAATTPLRDNWSQKAVESEAATADSDHAPSPSRPSFAEPTPVRTPQPAPVSTGPSEVEQQQQQQQQSAEYERQRAEQLRLAALRREAAASRAQTAREARATAYEGAPPPAHVPAPDQPPPGGMVPEEPLVVHQRKHVGDSLPVLYHRRASITAATQQEAAAAQSLQSHAEASKIAEVALTASGTPHSDAARDRVMRRRARRTAAGKG
jgi:hypothetical protein